MNKAQIYLDRNHTLIHRGSEHDFLIDAHGLLSIEELEDCALTLRHHNMADITPGENPLWVMNYAQSRGAYGQYNLLDNRRQYFWVERIPGDTWAVSGTTLGRLTRKNHGIPIAA